MQNEIIAEIHRHREDLARSCGYDVKKLMNHYRQRETHHANAGHKLVSYAKAAASTDENACVLRDEPPEKQQ